MEYIFDILFELIMEGSLDAVGNRKAPAALRILAAAVLIAVFGGLLGLCVYVSVTEKDILPLIAGAAAALVIGFGVYKTVKKHRN